jgi:hypothetical protein
MSSLVWELWYFSSPSLQSKHKNLALASILLLEIKSMIKLITYIGSFQPSSGDSYCMLRFYTSTSSENALKMAESNPIYVINTMAISIF